VTEPDHGEDGAAQHRGGADGEGHMQALGEGLAGRLEHGVVTSAPAAMNP
jgi:hypothetical protein